MSNPITFSAFTLLIKMCHMPKKDKFGTRSEKYCIFSWSLV